MNNENGKRLLRYGGIAGFIIAILLLCEIFVYAILTGYESPVEVFELFQENAFAGLLLFDLIGMVAYAFFIPYILALYVILNRYDWPLASMGATLFFISIGVFYATNPGFAVLALSRQYEVATTEEEKNMLLATCKTMITLFDINAFMISYVLVSISWSIISYVMLRSGSFTKGAAYAGIFAGLSGIVAEILENAFGQFDAVAIGLYFLAIVFLILWVVLTGHQLYQMSSMEHKTSM